MNPEGDEGAATTQEKVDFRKLVDREKIDPMKADYLYTTVMFHPPPSKNNEEFVGAFLRDCKDEMGRHEVEDNLRDMIGAGVDDEHDEEDTGVMVETWRAEDGRLAARLAIPKTPAGLRMRRKLLNNEYTGVSPQIDEMHGRVGKLGQQKYVVCGKRVTRLALTSDPAIQHAIGFRNTSVYASEKGPKEKGQKQNSCGARLAAQTQILFPNKKKRAAENPEKREPEKEMSNGDEKKSYIDTAELERLKAQAARLEALEKKVASLGDLQDREESLKKSTASLAQRKMALAKQTLVEPFTQKAKVLRGAKELMEAGDFKVLDEFLKSLEESSNDADKLEQLEDMYRVVSIMTDAAQSAAKASWDDAQKTHMEEFEKTQKENENYRKVLEEMRLANARASANSDPNFQSILKKAEELVSKSTPAKKEDTGAAKPSDGSADTEADAEPEKKEGTENKPKRVRKADETEEHEPHGVEQDEFLKSFQRGAMFASKVMKKRRVGDIEIMDAGNRDPEAAARTDKWLASILAMNE